MEEKQRIMTMLRSELRRWEALIASLSSAQLTTPLLPNHQSMKDVLAHLYAWQQVSIARLEAAQRNAEPVFPEWLAGLDPESETDREDFNARIHATYHAQPWSQVYQKWYAGFQWFLKLADAIPTADLLDATKYPWLKGYPLIAVLHGSYEHHHHDHLAPLLAWRQSTEGQEHGLRARERGGANR